jgi:hypothetical protein
VSTVVRRQPHERQNDAWRTVDPKDVEAILRECWGSHRYDSIAALHGPDYLEMVMSHVRSVPHVMREPGQPSLRRLLRKCDDYGVALSCVEMCDGGTGDDGLDAELRRLIDYDRKIEAGQKRG